MAFVEIQFPQAMAFGFTGGPRFSTELATNRSGYEQRNQNWEFELGKWSCSYEVKIQTQFDQIAAFFHVIGGSLIGFRFRDWSDYQVSGQVIGTGDGATATTQLFKTYRAAGRFYNRKITKPITSAVLQANGTPCADTVRIYFDGTEQLTGWTVDSTTGIVTFAVAPDADVIVTASFEFDVPVRLDIDHMDVVITDGMLYDWTSIVIVELRDGGIPAGQPSFTAFGAPVYGNGRLVRVHSGSLDIPTAGPGWIYFNALDLPDFNMLTATKVEAFTDVSYNGVLGVATVKVSTDAGATFPSTLCGAGGAFSGRFSVVLATGVGATTFDVTQVKFQAYNESSLNVTVAFPYSIFDIYGCGLIITTSDGRQHILYANIAKFVDGTLANGFYYIPIPFTPFLDEVVLPNNYEFKSTGGPAFMTEIATNASEYEQRRADWDQQFGKWSLSYGLQSQAQIDRLRAAFRIMRGRAYGIRMFDWWDHKCTLEPLGTGDGARVTFQLRKQYIAGGLGYFRTITKPVTSKVINLDGTPCADTVRIYFDGIEQGSGWTVDTRTGIVTFTSAPAGGVIVSATFEFHVPVRFETDELHIMIEAYKIFRWSNVSLREIRA